MLAVNRRSAGQVFESLRKEIIIFSEGKINDEEATKAARNLIGLFEAAMEVPEENRSFPLDEGENER